MQTEISEGEFLAERVKRPWGWYASTFMAAGFKTKVFSVDPGQKLSLQLHAHRRELWTVISGKGRCTVGDREFEMAKDSFVIVPQGVKHRIWNMSASEPLVISEVQAGDVLSEEDIVRYDDEYGRTGGATRADACI